MNLSSVIPTQNSLIEGHRKAVHEAGHAFVLSRLTEEPQVTFKGLGGAGKDLGPLHITILVTLGGPAAEGFVFNDVRIVSHDDIAMARNLLIESGCSGAMYNINQLLELIWEEIRSPSGQALFLELVISLSRAYRHHEAATHAALCGWMAYGADVPQA